MSMPSRPPARTAPRRPRRRPAAANEAQLREQTYRELKRRLIAGDLPPTALLSQRQLARTLGTSNTPVRSAIERLEAEGLVHIEPRRGVVLRELDPREMAELYEIRMVLEAYAVGRVAGKLSPVQASELNESLRRQRGAVDRGDAAELVELDAAFHLLICGFLGNRQILSTLERQRELIRRVIVRVTSAYPRRLAESVAEHEGIAEALLAGDGRLAAERLTSHLTRGRDLVVPVSTRG